jgi:phenylpropionate dioxygenase-like ring-hydroxylating dioxygenase large terminal subunit
MDSDTERRLIAEAAQIVQDRRTSISDAVVVVPRATYVDPARQKAEREVLFRKFPLAVALSARIPNKNDFVTEDVGGLRLIITRGADRVARVFVNACRHRGNVVCTAPSGNARRFVCGYHAWSYDTMGACKSVADDDAFQQVDPDTLGLIQLPSEERHGLVWTVPTPGAKIDVRAYLGDALDREIGDQKLDAQVVFAEDTLVRPFNWKLAVDTFQEVFHVNILHAETLKGLFSGLAAMEPFGRHHRFTAIRASFEKDFDPSDPEQSILPHASIVYLLFPNTVLIWQMDHIELWHIYPNAGNDNECVMRIFLLIPTAADERAQRYWRRNWELLQQSVWKEDFDVMSEIQKNLIAGGLPSMVFGRNEAALQHYHRQVNDVLATDSAQPAPSVAQGSPG